MFFRRKSRVKSEINAPVSTPSKINVCEFEILTQERDKILSIRVSALPNKFLWISLIRESIWYVGYCSTFLLWKFLLCNRLCSHTLVIHRSWDKKKLLHKWLMMGVVMIACSWKPFSDNRTFLLCFQVVLFSDSYQTSSWNFTTWCLFMACKFPLSRFTIHSHRKRMNSFGQEGRNWLLHLRENKWNTWRVERFCAFIVQSS